MGAVEGGGESPKAPRDEAHGTSRSDTKKRREHRGSPLRTGEQRGFT